MKIRDWDFEEWAAILMLVGLIVLLSTFPVAAWRTNYPVPKTSLSGKCDPYCAGCNAALQGGNE